MKDILTPEEREQVEGIRAELNTIELCEGTESLYDCAGNLGAHADNLLSIIDSLSPKQYTEEELRAEFERINYTYRLEKETFGRKVVYENQHVQTEFEGFVSCAQFLGALKE